MILSAMVHRVFGVVGVLRRVCVWPCFSCNHLLDLRPSSLKLVMLSETLVGLPHSWVAVCLGFVGFLNQSGLISGDGRHLMSCRQIPFRVLLQ